MRIEKWTRGENEKQNLLAVYIFRLIVNVMRKCT